MEDYSRSNKRLGKDLNERGIREKDKRHEHFANANIA
jgi:hypothetical protein